MIQFARAVGLEVSLATFGMLEDVLLKIGGKTGRNFGEKGSEQSASRSRSGSTVMESVALRSFYSLPTITESFDSDRLVGDLSQQPCSSRQADAALGFLRTEVNEFNDTDSLKTLGQIRSDVRKKCELYKWSREGRDVRTQICPVGRMVVDMFSPRWCWSSPRLRKFLLLVPKIRWRIVIASTACFVGETYPWDLGDYMNWNATSNNAIGSSSASDRNEFGSNDTIC